MLKLGVIGYGIRIKAIIKLLLDSGKVKLTAIADLRTGEISEELKKQGVSVK